MLTAVIQAPDYFNACHIELAQDVSHGPLCVTSRSDARLWPQQRRIPPLDRASGAVQAVSGKSSVLFVCLGNINRSPAAEAVFRDKVQRAGCADKFEIDSCGTGGGSSNWFKPDGFSYHEGMYARAAHAVKHQDGSPERAESWGAPMRHACSCTLQRWLRRHLTCLQTLNLACRRRRR